MMSINIHKQFKLNNVSFSKEDLIKKAIFFIENGLDYEKHLGQFLLDWLDDRSFVSVQTSGTTGTPKLIYVEKKAMEASAIATGIFFNLKPGDKSLLCMSAQYIAGKMMLVRALVLGLELDVIAPSATPLAVNSNYYDFVAMVPMQVASSMEDLYRVNTIIIGGAKLDSKLSLQLQSLGIKAYETYGMTETVSHIGVKRIQDDFFKVLPDVTIKTDVRNCLIIYAPKISNEAIVTNDIVEIISDDTFKWLGRFDNVINSGGVKLFPEQIENKLQDKIENRYFISGMKDERLGQKVILVIESNSEFKVHDSVFEKLERFEIPKAIFFTEKFEETATNKINRKATLLKIGVV